MCLKVAGDTKIIFIPDVPFKNIICTLPYLTSKIKGDCTHEFPLWGGCVWKIENSIFYVCLL